MAIKTGISWCDSTWNPSWGCDAVSAGCDNCYAERLANRLAGHFQVELKPNALKPATIRKLGPIKEDDGTVRPRLVFVNSMSDIFHEKIPDSWLDQCFDIMENMPGTIWQMLTKRPVRMKNYATARYGKHGSPPNLWFGVSVEDNNVKGRLNVLRRIEHQIGCTAFVSIEPLIGSVSEIDLEHISWVIIGGESGYHRRQMMIAWVYTAISKAREADAAIWFKQFGHYRDNPAYQSAREGRSHEEAVAYIVRTGHELHPEEKGGATLNGEILHELPESYHRLKIKMNAIAA